MPPEICTDSNHRAVFGDRRHSKKCCFRRLADAADVLRANDCRSLHLKLDDLCRLSNLGLELMGAYINRSVHLEDLTICAGTQSMRQMGGLRNVRRIGLLFAQIKNTVGLNTLVVEDDLLTLNGVHSTMLPFLGSSSTLLRLSLWGVNTERFNSMIYALDGRPIQEIQMQCGSIDHIDVLGECHLPDLIELDLVDNSISQVPSLEKCPKLQVLRLDANNVADVVGLGEWLGEGGSCMRELYLRDNELAQPQVDSMIHCLLRAQTLEIVDLVGFEDDETETIFGVLGSKGAASYLELVIGDVRCLASVLESNHVLQDCQIVTDSTHLEPLTRLFDEAVGINKRCGGDPLKAGRHKAIKFYLNGETRKLISQIQGTDTAYEEIFSTFPAAIMPEILSLIFSAHGASELYNALRAVAPDLLALVDRDLVAAKEIERRSKIVTSIDEKISALMGEREVHAERQWELRAEYKLEQGPPKRPKY